jgi:hypothetical protein
MIQARVDPRLVVSPETLRARHLIEWRYRLADGRGQDGRSLVASCVWKPDRQSRSVLDAEEPYELGPGVFDAVF